MKERPIPFLDWLFGKRERGPSDPELLRQSIKDMELLEAQLQLRLLTLHRNEQRRLRRVCEMMARDAARTKAGVTGDRPLLRRWATWSADGVCVLLDDKPANGMIYLDLDAADWEREVRRSIISRFRAAGAKLPEGYE